MTDREHRLWRHYDESLIGWLSTVNPNWRETGARKFFDMLLQEYPEPNRRRHTTAEDHVRALDPQLFRVNYGDVTCWNPLFFEIEKIIVALGGSDRINHDHLARALTNVLEKQGPQGRALARVVHPRSKTITDVIRQWHSECKHYISNVNHYWNWLADMGAIPRFGEPWTAAYAAAGPGEQLPPRFPKGGDHKGDGKVKPKGKTEGPPFPNKKWEKDKAKAATEGEEVKPKKPKVDPTSSKCTACGRSGHDASTCVYNMSWGQHPDRNTTKAPFAESAVGKKWKEQGKDVLPHNITLDGSAFTSVPTWAADLSEEEYKAKLKERTSRKRDKRKFEDALGAVTTATDSATLPCQITLSGHVIDTRFFLDSGAVSGNYVNEDLAKRLRAAGAKEYPQAGKRVCMAIGSVCRPCGNIFEFPLRFFNEATNDHESIDIKASVFDMQWPIMIGLPSIRTHRLTQKLMSHRPTG